MINKPICRLSVATWPVQQDKDDKLCVQTRRKKEVERLLLTKTTREPYKRNKHRHFCSCGLLLYFSPAEGCPDCRQFSVDNVNLLIKTYMSEKVKTWLWICEWFIIQMKGELRLTGYKHHQLVFFQFYDYLPFYFSKNSTTKRTGVLSFSLYIFSWKMVYTADIFQMKHLSRLSQNNIKVKTQLAFVKTGKSPPMFFLLKYEGYSLQVMAYLEEKMQQTIVLPKSASWSFPAVSVLVVSLNFIHLKWFKC